LRVPSYPGDAEDCCTSSTDMRNFVLVAFMASVVAVYVSEAAPAPEEEGAGMRSALEYLQKLDKYYSQIARPRRASRSSAKREDMASALMKLSQIREHYSAAGRPRFGKRSGSDTSAIPGYLVGDDYFLPVSSEN